MLLTGKNPLYVKSEIILTSLEGTQDYGQSFTCSWNTSTSIHFVLESLKKKIRWIPLSFYFFFPCVLIDLDVKFPNVKKYHSSVKFCHSYYLTALQCSIIPKERYLFCSFSGTISLAFSWLLGIFTEKSCLLRTKIINKIINPSFLKGKC